MLNTYRGLEFADAISVVPGSSESLTRGALAYSTTDPLSQVAPVSNMSGSSSAPFPGSSSSGPLLSEYWEFISTVLNRPLYCTTDSHITHLKSRSSRNLALPLRPFVLPKRALLPLGRYSTEGISMHKDVAFFLTSVAQKHRGTFCGAWVSSETWLFYPNSTLHDATLPPLLLPRIEFTHFSLSYIDSLASFNPGQSALPAAYHSCESVLTSCGDGVYTGGPTHFLLEPPMSRIPFRSSFDVASMLRFAPFILHHSR